MNKLFATSVLGPGIIMLLGSNFYNLGQFAFHFIVGRSLGKVQYGDLAVLISILGIVSVFQQGFSISIIKHIASGTKEEMEGFIFWVMKYSAYAVGVLGAVLLILFMMFGNFLKFTDANLLIFLIPLSGFLILTNTFRSVLQGMLKFGQFSLSLVLEASVKLALIVVFFSFGYKTYGALGAMLVSFILAFILVIFFLRKDIKKTNFTRRRDFLKYSAVAFVSSLALISFYSSDLLLVKSYLSSTEAGIYAAVSILGRIIFFGITPLTQTVFPIIAKRHELSEDYKSVLWGSIGLILLFVVVIEIFYIVWPEFLVNLLYGPQFNDVSLYIWKYGLFMGIVGLCFHISQYYLSIGNKEAVVIVVFGAFLQIALIILNHSDIDSIINNSIITSIIMLGIFFIYSFWRKPLLKFKL